MSVRHIFDGVFCQGCWRFAWPFLLDWQLSHSLDISLGQQRSYIAVKQNL